MYICLYIYIYIHLKLDSISLLIGLYDIKLLFVVYWCYKQYIHSKNSYNCEDVNNFSHEFIIIYLKMIS